MLNKLMLVAFATFRIIQCCR